jgi:chemotaxis protein MotA
MDIATPLGLVMIVLLMLWGMGFNIGPFMDFGSAAIVIGGTFGAIFVSFPLPVLKGIPKIFMKTIKNEVPNNIEIIKSLVKFSEKARKEGLLSLEQDLAEIDEEFLKKGMQLVVDGTDPELVKSILDSEISFIEQRHGQGKSILKTGAALGPAYGMIGTLIGLIQMLGNLNDPSAVGPAMAIALITTLYGSMLANIFFDPMANKLEYYSAQEILSKEITIEGILSIQGGDNPKVLEEKLKSFLPPNERQDLEQEEGE